MNRSHYIAASVAGAAILSILTAGLFKAYQPAATVLQGQIEATERLYTFDPADQEEM